MFDTKQREEEKTKQNKTSPYLVALLLEKNLTSRINLEGWDICTLTADSPCCTAETSTTLWSNYPPITHLRIINLKHSVFTEECLPPASPTRGNTDPTNWKSEFLVGCTGSHWPAAGAHTKGNQSGTPCSFILMGINETWGNFTPEFL